MVAVQTHCSTLYAMQISLARPNHNTLLLTSRQKATYKKRQCLKVPIDLLHNKPIHSTQKHNIRLIGCSHQQSCVRIPLPCMQATPLATFLLHLQAAPENATKGIPAPSFALLDFIKRAISTDTKAQIRQQGHLGVQWHMHTSAKPHTRSFSVANNDL